MIDAYQHGIIVQTVGELEDELDGETMMETEALHNEHFLSLEKELRKPVSEDETDQCRKLREMQGLHLSGCTMPVPG